MNKLDSLTLRAKVMATIALLLGLMLVIAIDAIINFNQIKSASEQLADEALPVIEISAGLEEYAARKKLYLVDYLRTADTGTRQAIAAAQASFADYLQQGRQLSSQTQGAQFANALTELEKNSGTFNRQLAEILQRQQQLFTITEDRARAATRLNDILDATTGSLRAAIMADQRATNLTADLTTLFALTEIDDAFSEFNIEVLRADLADDTRAVQSLLATGSLTDLAERLRVSAARAASRADLTGLANTPELIRDYERSLRAYIEQSQLVVATVEQLLTLGDEMMDQAEAMTENALELSLQVAGQNVADVKQGLWVISILSVIAIALGSFAGFWLVRNVMRALGADPEALRTAVNDIAAGNFNQTFAADIPHGSVMDGMQQMTIALREAALLAVENSRIRQSLDGASVCVMIADNDRKIIYLNEAVQKMLRETETALREVLPQFSANNILGQSMDVFHKNPAHQSSLLDKLTSTYMSNITVGKLHFRLTANPIIGADKQRLGTVVEWLDRTAEVKAEQEIDTVVKAAAAGDFSQRLNESNKQGFMLQMGQGLNAIIDNAETGLTDIERVMSAMAQGDLTSRIDADYQGMFEQIKTAVNNTVSNMGQMLGDIREAADTINTASSEISQGNTDLSSRTEQQASSLEETASSMEELTSTVRQNADNARQANTLAAKASDVAVEGGSLIEQVVKTMASINESAQKISDIIGVIDGIAFQTNILALNAAVEAARAGEQGRGFAVVASEVRTLAQRSANAAKDIKALISDSVNKINNGNDLVGKSGNTMKEVVTSIKRVNDIMAEIAAASAEQSAGLDEVGKAVVQMDEMTQQNAALVEEAAAAAESLLSQSEQLARNVARFTLDDEPARPVAARAIASPKKQLKAPPKKAAAKLMKPAKSDEDEWESF